MIGGVACRSPEMDAVSADATRAVNDLGKQIDDFTGVTQRTSVSEAADAIRDRAQELDIQSLNETVAGINVLVREIRSRVITLPEDAGAIWATAVEQADLKGVSERLRALTDTVAAQVERFDPDAANAVVGELRTLVSEVSQRVTEVNIDETNNLINEARSLQPTLDAALLEATALAAELRRAVRAAPTAQAERTLTQLERVGASVAPVVQTMTILFCTAMAGLCVVLLWMTILLRRMTRTGRP